MQEPGLKNSFVPKYFLSESPITPHVNLRQVFHLDGHIKIETERKFGQYT